MLMKIFQHVDQVDQLLNCKIVCKKWYSIIHQMIRLNSLVISRVNVYKFLSEKWFSPNDQIQFLYDYQYKVVSRHSKIIRFNMNQPLLSQLKKLFIYYRNIWTNSINCLSYLEVLMLNYTELISKDDVSLNLPHLREFSFRSNGHYHNLTLNCPKLEKLAYYSSVNLSIIHPECIKELNTGYNKNFMFELVNCEYLYLEYGHFDENILLKLKKLKELHNNSKDFDILNSFLEQKNSLKRTNLKIYYLNLLSDSFSLANLNQIHTSFVDEKRIDIDTIHFYGPNYSNLPYKVYFIDTVDYNVIENYFWANPNQIARRIIKTLVQLNHLILSDQIRDVNQFICVLKDRRYLNTVRITAEFMPQNFFDQILAENCSIIEQLIVHNRNQLNFDFLLKFKELQSFQTGQHLTSELIFKLFDKFELLESIAFHYAGNEVRIKLDDRKKFNILLNCVRNVFDNLEDLISYLDLSAQNSV